MLSCALILLGFVSMFVRGGLNYGIDFMGGTLARRALFQAGVRGRRSAPLSTAPICAR